MKRKFLLFTTLSLLTSMSVVACGGGGDDPSGEKFDFSISFVKTGNNTLFAGTQDSIRIVEKNAEKGKSYSYTISFSGDDFSDDDPVSKYVTAEYLENSDGKFFVVDPKFSTDGRTITASVKEASVKKAKSLFFTIKGANIEPANAGYNYAADKEKRLQILGELEKYAMENYLTGITLFENGGYVKYSDRVKIRATEYITGYGWGVLTEGSLNGRLPGISEAAEPDYYQSAESSDPLTINAWDATGSQVSDLNSYISTSYWGTKMKGTTESEWYPILAKDTIKNDKGQTVVNDRPIAQDLDPNNKTGLYKVWRIYVKTGDDGIKFRTASTINSEFNNRKVTLDDYEFVYQMLLSERSQLVRGAELAGDTTYGIKGGQAFFRKSKNMTDNDKLDKLWADMKKSGELGIRTGKDDVNGSYIELELVNPIDSFTAMYTLSSNLYTPMPKEFIKKIGGGDYTEGARLFGTFPSKGGVASSHAMDYTLCLGAYYLKKWNMNQETIFARNDDWFEYTPGGSRYQIPGIRIVVIDSSTNPLAVWQHFENNELDSAGIPKDKLPDFDLSKERKSGGDATFKLNVNSCSQDEWNRLFGTNGVIKQGKDNDYECKYWMSNKNFLKGLYWSINREKFAKDRGVTPSFSYFASSYMSDPEKNVSYNSTEEHIKAVENFHNVTPDPKDPSKVVDDYGYDVGTAVKAFSDAIKELSDAGRISLGTKEKPTVIEISIVWMYQTDIRDYGNDIVADFKAAFEDPNVCGNKVTLEVKQSAVAQWDQVYNDYLMVGKYDLGFGAISGNSYNPLNFMEVLKSDNSSGFTLNWGTNTGVIDENSPIEFDGKLWSFDALWAAGDHGTVVTHGRDESPVTNDYVKSYTTNRLYDGVNIEVPFSFTEVDKSSVEFKVEKDKDVQLYLLGAGTIRATDKDEHGTQYFSVEETSDGYKIVITPAGGAAINQLLVDANDLEKEAEKKTDPDEKYKILHPFTAENYNIYWNIEVHYTISINGGQPSENVAYVYRDKAQQDSDRK